MDIYHQLNWHHTVYANLFPYSFTLTSRENRDHINHIIIIIIILIIRVMSEAMLMDNIIIYCFPYAGNLISFEMK